MKDNFSVQAAEYARYRPSYPQALYDFILQQVNKRGTAWDCATGNGQVAGKLSEYFERVYATDISQSQIDHATKAPNIYYSIQAAEQTNFPDHFFDLVTVAQAIHWFRFDDFYKEVKRVVKPGGIIAFWTYSLLQISEPIDQIISHYHFNTMGPYWDEERKYVDDHYRDIPLPFPEIKCPSFQIVVNWSLKDLEGYLRTWSALQKYLKQNDQHPVPPLIAQVKEHWGPQELRTIIFPLFLRAGRI